MSLVVAIERVSTMQPLSGKRYCGYYTRFRFPQTAPTDDAENNTSKSHSPRMLLMAPAQQEETILVEGTGVVPAKCFLKIKSELFSLL